MLPLDSNQMIKKNVYSHNMSCIFYSCYLSFKGQIPDSSVYLYGANRSSNYFIKPKAYVVTIIRIYV